MRSSLRGVFYQHPLAGGCCLVVSYQILVPVRKVSDINLAVDSDLLDTQSGTLSLADSLDYYYYYKAKLYEAPQCLSIHRL
jgi:hypothetical protein